MNELARQGNERVKELRKMISEVEERKKFAPTGKLRVTKHRQGYQFYYRKERGDYKGKYIKKSQMGLVTELAQKEYDEKVLASAEQEIRAIMEMANSYPENIAEELYDLLPPVRQSLVCPVKETDRQFVERWVKEEFQHKDIRNDCPEYYTDRNERVRSKSEILIANALNKRGIHYRYECVLNLDKAFAIYPDFTILDVKNRREIYWEHLGMMDDPAYCREAVKRISFYESHGIFPGKELIISHETKNSPLSVRMIEEMIDHYLKDN